MTKMKSVDHGQERVPQGGEDLGPVQVLSERHS